METQPQTTATEAKPARPRIRVSKVMLEGFKAFKEPFTLEIPPPLALDDPDVIVIGSSNGVGKTSLLEGICLGMLAPEVTLYATTPPQQLLINATSDSASVSLVVHHDGEVSGATTRVEPATESTPLMRLQETAFAWRGGERRTARRLMEAFLVLGQDDDDPFVGPPVLYFHSYRRVPVADLDLAQLTSSTAPLPGEERNEFKLRTTKALMANADLVEDVPAGEATTRTLGQLNSLLQQFAGVRTEKVKIAGSRLQVRVAPADGRPMPFDALSSGQKEIISTLFLIWEATRDCPSVVLIDEPELHLHQEWHDDVMRMLFELAPQNQYIIATHSQRIAESVPRDRLRLIRP